MELHLLPLTDPAAILRTYPIYKHCMYLPTAEKFRRKADVFLRDDSVKFFACLHRGLMKGVIVLSFSGQFTAEILGIAVDESSRNQGIGSYMIHRVTDECNLISVYAETDADAVGFYRKNGFCVTEFQKTYDGESVVRYACEYRK